MEKHNGFLQKYGLLIFRIILCGLSWTAILIMLLPSILSLQFILFCFYTVQTNLMVLIWITLAIIYTRKDEKPFILGPVVRGGITVYITITFLVFVTLLQPFYFPTDPVGITVNILAHYVVPIFFIIDWIITERKKRYEKKYALYWLSYPLFYLGYSLIQGLITGFYPYYFIDLNAIGPFVILFSMLLALLFYIIGRLYIFLNLKLFEKSR
ncbi:MAG: hypothetical protein EU541_07825 [Promethearchaeota archaeon]|nr:MAG: hypothetical protein EU541_07825 [Candidatus Lokiarchaeota archaeon]